MFNFPNRTLCSVLEEMRKCYKTRNFSALEGLIEEVQSLGNRMEAGLEEKGDYYHVHEKVKSLKKEQKRLEKKVAKLKRKAGEKETDKGE